MGIKHWPGGVELLEESRQVSAYSQVITIVLSVTFKE
jgi:hypothetical protein